jgi:hypothetical protein
MSIAQCPDVKVRRLPESKRDAAAIPFGDQP